MTHSTSLPWLNLLQVRILPLASSFSLYPIHFIPYSWLHMTTFGSQQIWVRHPLWLANIPPQWLWLWYYKLMWICVNDVVQIVTWVNIAGCIKLQTLKNFNCMWTRDLNVLLLFTTTCSSQYVYFMTMVSPSTAIVVVRGKYLIYTSFMIKFPW